MTDGSGRLIALCRQHGRWIQLTPSAAPSGASAEATRPLAVPEGLTGLLGTPAADGDGSAHLVLAVTGDLANPVGDLHGGITLCACDLVAQAALAAVAGPPRTTSIHVAYTRPVPGGTAARFAGRVLHRGRALAVVQVTVLNESGKPCAIATVTTGPPA